MENHEHVTNETRGPGYETPDQHPRQAPPPVYPRRDLPMKSTAFAVILSAIIPGLGQVYVGYYKHAFLYIAVVASTITLLASNDQSGLAPLLGVFLGFFYFYQVVDAGRKASIYNQVLERGEAVDLASDELPEVGGSVFGGAALLIIGVIALSNTVLHVSLDWLEDWWPVALIVVGAWIIRKSRQDKVLKD